ncbi:putative vacuolar protein sorting-associated protein [Trypanosoma rangeli]|uniref:Putative vacuolar protein sorting-associated protein n=1 Tax=Trypanosoma rangeli TaxID=5698 RepID=A0A3R7P4L0_TRYRA|nr:putative vacuolar protein sorting-associated protein [Trypanosoma rangeli]RNF12638.1 putative vacuolar protein sorting-associated protein [Trypanosoma rangeli]|eukprot:RNF12638.1 putative vacuolar protein sorting-associated protein [Trypanosoma rangeli]
MNSRSEFLRLGGIRETIKVELASLLDSLDSGSRSTKVLYIAPHLLSTFEAIGLSEELFSSNHGVIGVFPYEAEIAFVSTQHAVFILNPDMENIRSLVVNILSNSKTHARTLIHVFFVPRKPLMIGHALENEYKLMRAVPGLSLGEFDLDLIPLEDDFLSMQQPLALKHLIADGDIALLQWIARMILKLQTSRFGAISLIRGKGTRATKVIQILHRMQSEVGSEFLTDLTPEIGSLFILDRTLDLLTPLMTQLTYEGLIDEFYNIDAGYVNFPFNLGDGAKLELGQRVFLNHADKVYGEIRDKNFANVGLTLYNKSVWIKKSYERRKEVQQLKELKEFMKGLPEMQELHRLIGMHTAVATEIGKRTQSIEFRRRVTMEQSIIQQVNEREVVDYIEELINKNVPIADVLRLISLYSLVNGGLKSKTYDFFKENIMLSYGIPQGLAAFFALERSGLITKHDNKQPNFSTIRKQLKLWYDALQEQQPNDISYVYSGYASLLVRLLEFMISHPENWNTPSDATDFVAGEKLEIRNEVEPSGVTPTTMVFVIGGITYAEISALRYVQTKLADAGRARRILVASTHITNGKQMIGSLLPFFTEDK